MDFPVFPWCIIIVCSLLSDGLFVSYSALTVTGLTSVNFTQFSWLSQFVTLLLMQMGGQLLSLLSLYFSLRGSHGVAVGVLCRCCLVFSSSIIFATKKLWTNRFDVEERRTAGGCRRSCRGQLERMQEDKVGWKITSSLGASIEHRFRVAMQEWECPMSRKRSAENLVQVHFLLMFSVLLFVVLLSLFFSSYLSLCAMILPSLPLILFPSSLSLSQWCCTSPSVFPFLSFPSLWSVPSLRTPPRSSSP